MKDLKEQFVPEYRAQITLTQPKCLVTVTASSPADVQNTITQLLRGKTTFDANQNNTVLVFNDQHLGGEYPIGWIVEFDAPIAMSVKALADHRISLVQKAA